MARSLFRPVPVATRGARVRFDLSASSDSPADVLPSGGGGAISGSTLYSNPSDGTFGTAIFGPDGVTTLIQKTLSSAGTPTGEAYTLVAGDPDNSDGPTGCYPSIAVAGATPAPVAVMGTNFASGHGYANNATGTVNLNDTSDYALGVQSVTVTTDGIGGVKTIKKTGFTPINTTGLRPVVWVKCPDSTKLATLQLYLGDTSLANSWKWDMQSSADQKWITDGDWHRYDLSWTNAVTTGSPSRSAVTDAQFRIVDDTTGPVTVRLGGWALVAETTTWSHGVVSLTFDDSYLAHYTQARAKMDQYGFPGTAYVIQDLIGTSGRVTVAQLQAMQTLSGWEVAGHSTTDAIHTARLTSLSAAQLAVEFAAQRQWLALNSFTGDHTAYPGGLYNNDVLAQCESLMTGARTTYPRPETLSPARRSKLRCGGYVSSSTPTATLTAMVDAAYTNKDWLIFGFHDLPASASVSTDYSIANFGTVIDYIAGKGIPVRTVGDVLRSRP